ncbi:hypothetical protein F2P79_001322 [Pimephales promelas]|nr:hypothetical protein F2P79_001322 [Pimephales promelas]
MDRSVFVLLLSGLFWSSSALSRQYHYINVRMSWPEAQSYCREKYTDLATVDTMDDVNRLVNIVDAGYSGSVWIGLKRGTQKRWGWSNGENIQYITWASGEPNENADCAFHRNGVWGDMGCSYGQYFVCYKENATYIMVKTGKNWTDAQSYCREYYTDLATIHNFQENQQLTKILLTGYYFWIGRKYQYQFINESKTWQDAQSYCRARFTDLATADSMSDVSLLVNSVDAGYRGSVWIGLHNGTEYRWVWSMGSLSQYSNWYPGEPNGDGECVISFNGRWYDESCSTVLPFVCFNDSTGFIITETALTWRDAQSYCRKQHTDLASISSAEQQNLIGNNAGSLWIGLFKDSWEWSDRWNLSFRNWAAGQPSQSSGSGDCVGMATTDTGKWAQYSCDLQQPFICYGGEFPQFK